LPALITLAAVMNGGQEVPPNASMAQGNATLVFDTATNKFSLNAFVTGIPLANVADFHIHQGTFGFDGPDILELLPASGMNFVNSDGGISFSASNVNFPTAFVADLLAGRTSIEIHTTTFGGHGEIQGQLLHPHLFVTGADAGAAPHVEAFSNTNPTVAVQSFFAFDPHFTGGVRVAAGDVNGDGTDDIIVGAGPGGGPQVEVFDGQTGALIRSFFAFDPGFRGGVKVAAGDVNGDGFADIIVGAGPGGGPNVKVFSGKDGSLLSSFFAFDPGFTGGITVAAGDTNHDRLADVIVGAGPGGGPNVKVFSGRDMTLLSSFFAFDPSFRGGVFVAAGDVNGDGQGDIIVGAGPGGGPRVAAFDGQTQAMLANFFAFDTTFAGGVRVAAVAGDGRDEIVTAPGAGTGQPLRIFAGTTATMLEDFFAFPGFSGGSFVGGQ
jgi:hypothetical protein